MRNAFILSIVTICGFSYGMDKPDADITLISADNQRYQVPGTVALKVQLIDDLSKCPLTQNRQDEIHLTSVNSPELKIIADIMRTAHAHDSLNGKALLELLARQVKCPEQQLFNLLKACDFLNFKRGIQFIGANGEKKLLEKFLRKAKKNQIGFGTAQELARTHYLMTKSHLHHIDRENITFSLQDYLDYQPETITRARSTDLLDALDLPKKQLTDLEGLLAIPGIHNLESINISENQLPQLPINIFASLSKLISINLTSNKLTQLPPDIFVGLKNLQTLRLSHNKLTQLPAAIFTGLSNLQELALDYIKLSQLPADLFAGLNNLQTIDLSSNQLTHLPCNIFVGLNYLQKLDLGLNQLTELPHNIFASLNFLRDLSLFNNQLTQLPCTIFAGLTNLERLGLSQNRLIDLPPCIFAGLTKLQGLNISHNQLTKLPSNIFEGLTNLQWLDLTCYKQSTELPPDIFWGRGLINLEKICLSSEQKSKLPENSFLALKNLKKVVIDYA